MPEEKQKKDVTERQIVIFTLGKEEFGVNIEEVREIIRFEEITKLPNTEEYIKGVINLRGGIIVVVDLAMKLGLASKEMDNNSRILIVEVGSNTIGMIVDSATEVMRLAKENVQEAPEIITKKINADYIEGVGILDERLLILLDLGKVLDKSEREGVQAAQVSTDAAPTSEPQAKGSSESSEDKGKES